MKTSLDSVGFVSTSRCPLEVISVSAVYVTWTVIAEAVRFVCDIIRVVQTEAIHLFDSLFQC